MFQPSKGSNKFKTFQKFFEGRTYGGPTEGFSTIVGVKRVVIKH